MKPRGETYSLAWKTFGYFWVALGFLSFMDHGLNERQTFSSLCFRKVFIYFFALCFRWCFKRNDYVTLIQCHAEKLHLFCVLRRSASLPGGTDENDRVLLSGLWLSLREAQTAE